MSIELVSVTLISHLLYLYYNVYLYFCNYNLTVLLKHGPSPIHRKSYAPVKRALESFKSNQIETLNDQKVSDVKLINNATKKNKLIITKDTTLESKSKSNKLKRDNSIINNLDIIELKRSKRDNANTLNIYNDCSKVSTSGIRKSLRISKRLHINE